MLIPRILHQRLLGPDPDGGRCEQAEPEARLRRARPHRPARLVSRTTPADEPDEYTDLHAFCLFVGYPRSGHSLIGALLDAHPEIVIAHEANALKLVLVKGASRRLLFETLIDNSSRQARRSRKSSGYSYAVEGQWQGRTRTLRVIGDKSGQKAASWLGRDPAALTELEQLVGVPVRLMHITRNPYDTVARISTITRAGTPKRSLSAAIEFVGRLAAATERVIAEGRFPVLTNRHELFVQQPQEELRKMCSFLGVDPEDSYLEACAKIVFETPQRARDHVEWTDEEIEAVQQLIDRHAFLAGYS